jgi:hypothetical protein
LIGSLIGRLIRALARWLGVGHRRETDKRRVLRAVNRQG